MPVLQGTRSTLLSSPKALASGLLLMTALSGCSFVEDRSERYVSAEEGKPLELPASAEKSRFSQVMPIRDVTVADASKLYPSDIPNPPDMTSEILEENYVIEELDGRVWLLVNDVPGRIWPAANAYMADRGLGVDYDSPQLGLLQSELLNFSRRARQLAELPNQAGVDEPRVVLQVRMAPGVRRKTTEIQVRKLTVEGQPEELVPWSGVSNPSPEALELQKRLLTDMGDFLKAREENKSFSRAASGMVSDPLVKLVSEDDQAIAIRMSLDYGRSWAEVSRALTEASVAVVDLNRSEGWFYVDFRTDDERDSGWFNWFSDEEKPEHTHTVTLAERDDDIVITTERLASYDGELSAPDLLTQLFDYLY
ncbi:outer membrane protein assembly factor BamC [Marinobacter sp. F4206]|uniref:outer membrane protein assembly factor BamC n=1 Tax=Marinobacter sp. F4206 TaxID=2861777 RepID=UPI001C603156|nr:outer membrane protein assembly factor BamC [Marinobacter sp. F4206]MBW4933452.1 outer membrane protein assembly factor BamC [Marinobacter sp. F4206]